MLVHQRVGWIRRRKESGFPVAVFARVTSSCCQGRAWFSGVAELWSTVASSNHQWIWQVQLLPQHIGQLFVKWGGELRVAPGWCWSCAADSSLILKNWITSSLCCVISVAYPCISYIWGIMKPDPWPCSTILPFDSARELQWIPWSLTTTTWSPSSEIWAQRRWTMAGPWPEHTMDVWSPRRSKKSSATIRRRDKRHGMACGGAMDKLRRWIFEMWMYTWSYSTYIYIIIIYNYIYNYI